MAAPDIDLTADFFALLHLPRKQLQDAAMIDANFRELQARVHPDKHMHASTVDQRLAMQWATRVNEAYQTIKSPLNRARYLLGLMGHDVASESNTAMSTEFLMAQMELREAVEAAQSLAGGRQVPQGFPSVIGAGETATFSADTAIEALTALDGDLAREIRAEHVRLAALIDDAHDYLRASELVCQLMFQEKLRDEIADALDGVSA